MKVYISLLYFQKTSDQTNYLSPYLSPYAPDNQKIREVVNGETNSQGLSNIGTKTFTMVREEKRRNIFENQNKQR